MCSSYNGMGKYMVRGSQVIFPATADCINSHSVVQACKKQISAMNTAFTGHFWLTYEIWFSYN